MRAGGAAEAVKVDGVPYGGDAAYDVVNAWITAWAQKDTSKCLAMLGAQGIVLDTVASQKQGIAVGQGAAATLQGVFSYYPASGLSVDIVDLKTISLPNNNTIVSFRREVTGPSFFESGLCCIVVSDGNLAAAIAVQPRPATGHVLELDYCCVPVVDIERGRAFYEGKLQLGTPYSDEGWYGWWSSGAVLGTFEADPSEDGIPVRGFANGYPSLWVKSARDTEQLVKANGGTFPCIPAINDHPGVDSHPGYIQVTAADPDGNIFLGTEYTGRRDL